MRSVASGPGTSPLFVGGGVGTTLGPKPRQDVARQPSRGLPASLSRPRSRRPICKALAMPARRASVNICVERSFPCFVERSSLLVIYACMVLSNLITAWL